MKYIKVGGEGSKPLTKSYGFKKKCSKCEKEKTLKSFYRRGGTGLLQSRCIVCTKEAALDSRKRVSNVVKTLMSGRLIEL